MLSPRLALALLAALAPASSRAPSDPSPVSCSIDGIADYSRTLHFCDLMRQTRPFGSAQAPYDHNCSVGADGWPTQGDFGLVFITLPSGAPPVGVLIDGVYTLRFTGRAATLSFPVSTATLLNSSYDAAADATLAFIEVPPANNGQLWISWHGAALASGAAGAKGVMLLQPGCALADPLAVSPSLLSLLTRFDSLRFMDLLATNDSPQAEWADRRLMTDPSYAYTVANTTGIPWEQAVHIVNSVERDMWINIPAHASDDYIANLAVLLRDSVDPSLNIYYEYSNEARL